MKKQRQKWVCFLEVLTLVLGGAVCLQHAAGTRRRTGPGAGNGTQGDGGIRREHGGYGGLRLDPTQGLHPAGPGGRGTLLPL